MSLEVLLTYTSSLAVKRIRRLSRSSILALWALLRRFRTGLLDFINADGATKVILTSSFTLPAALSVECRIDFVDVANVISKYKSAEIPLETMWADIGTSLYRLCSGLKLIDIYYSDYMDRRRIFTVDPDYFPMNRMQEIVSYLHAHDQKFGA